MTPENDHCIRPEPEFTCPDVDACQDLARDLIEKLETIRANNKELRAWGEDWRDLALDKHEEIKRLEAELETTTDLVTELQYEITRLNDIIDQE